MTNSKINRLGQALQIGECLYIIYGGGLWRVGACENLNAPGAYTLMGAVSDDCADADLAKCVEDYGIAQWNARQAQRAQANHEIAPNPLPHSKKTGVLLCLWCCHPEARGEHNFQSSCTCGTQLS